MDEGFHLQKVSGLFCFVLFCIFFGGGGGYFSMNKVNAYNSILAKICSILKIDIIF